jgi:DNA-binding response OmpR family regulator
MGGPAGKDGDGARKRVLLVEDEVLIGMMVASMLEELGFEVAGTATRIEEAARMARELPLDAAILDMNLAGVRVDRVAEELAQRGVPILFATGYGAAGPDDIHRGRPALAKPFTRDQLEAALSELFHNGRAA